MIDRPEDCTSDVEETRGVQLITADRTDDLARASLDALRHPHVVLEALRDSERRVMDFVLRAANRAACVYLGVRSDELIGRKASDNTQGVGKSGLLERFADCLDGGEPVALDDFPYHSSVLNDWRRFDIHAARIGVDLLSVSWTDVTDRSVITDRIARSERHFRLLAENIGDVVTHIRDGRFVWVSTSATDILGRSPQHLVGRKVLDFVSVTDQAAHFARLAAIANGEAVFTRAQFLADDGTAHWIHLHALAFHDRDGKPDGWTASFRLIDDKVADERLIEEARLQRARAEERYRKLADNSAIGVALVTPDGRLDTVNPAMCDFFGYDADTLCTRTWQKLTAPDFIEKDLDNVADVLAGRIDSYRMKKQYVHADGHLLWGDLSVSCIRTPDDDVEVFISQIMDITAEVEAQRKIAEREELNRILTSRLQAQTDRMQAELHRAAEYVASILPRELDGPVRVSSCYLPAQELAGDSYDYVWVDQDHLAFYLIDVSGHGIGPALLSVSVHNMLRHAPVPTDTVLEPAKMLALLNGLFQMDQQDNHYLTIWYGVYQASTRTLRYASAGHPPALAFLADGSDISIARLTTESLPIGLFRDSQFTCGTFAVPAGCQILLFSDGVFDFALPGGQSWTLRDFVDLCTQIAGSPGWSLDDLVARLRDVTAGWATEDDCSLVHLRFD